MLAEKPIRLLAYSCPSSRWSRRSPAAKQDRHGQGKAPDGLLGQHKRYAPMRGFGSVASAARFCPAFEEQRQYVRARRRIDERVTLAERRRLFRARWGALLGEVQAA